MLRYLMISQKYLITLLTTTQKLLLKLTVMRSNALTTTGQLNKFSHLKMMGIIYLI